MFSFLCLVFSFPCPLCALCTVSTCPGVHVAMCSHCFVFSLCCVSVVCVMCSGVQVVVVCCVLCSHRVQCVGVVIPWRVSVVCCMLLLCVQDVVLYCMCVCAACKKRGFHPAKNIYKKSAFFLKIIVVFLAYMKKKMYLCSVKMKE